MKTVTSTTTITFIFVRNVQPNEWQRNEAGQRQRKSEIPIFTEVNRDCMDTLEINAIVVMGGVQRHPYTERLYRT